MSKQIRFLDLEDNLTHGGILLDDGNVICGCCGGLLKAGEEGKTWKLIEVYKNWVDLTDEICGETDLPNEPQFHDTGESATVSVLRGETYTDRVVTIRELMLSHAGEFYTIFLWNANGGREMELSIDDLPPDTRVLSWSYDTGRADIMIELPGTKNLPIRISMLDIRRGLTDGDITLVERGDDIAAQIGEHWFWFGAKNGDCGMEIHCDTTPFEEDVKAIWEVVNAEPINGMTEDEATECLYYAGVLHENFAARNAQFAGREKTPSQADWIDACYKYLNWQDSHKNPYEMTTKELTDAETELDECEPGISWVAHAGYKGLVPQDKRSGHLILC